MKSIFLRLKKYAVVQRVIVALAFLTFSLFTTTARADDEAAAGSDSTTSATADDGDKTWKEVRKAIQPPMPPLEWQTNFFSLYDVA